MNCLAVIVRFLSNLFVLPTVEMKPLCHVEIEDRGPRCICTHDAADHVDRTGWCSHGDCSYFEPRPEWIDTWNPVFVPVIEEVA